jgi:hypothetical protein
VCLLARREKRERETLLKLWVVMSCFTYVDARSWWALGRQASRSVVHVLRVGIMLACLQSCGRFASERNPLYSSLVY